ncbi:nucleoside deaminase [Kaistella flava (ex Peng et al. 2021)]|uniref:Nucleoside deaminase n=1 Tax=Kaistella flava (ex Peng et al. 2021) TaxID=2038776 RepID=A0A7M2Y4L5_9FLAO|nr:nucleoside deaminase [Kaistella flava (ex Peng et al. 2021)]QOW09178.1 nucleoside deaminase [Kaistella flava (ex Peng et al. 2021)]
MAQQLKEIDGKYLRRCLELAKEAVEAGDEAFGSILVDEDGKIIEEARNRVNEKTILAHPEIDLAYWAAENLSEEERAKTTMYTTGEHCPMCSAAHGWVGLGALVYLSSARQLGEWQKEYNLPEAKINFLPVEDIIKNIEIRGPAEGDLLEEIKKLHQKAWTKK